MKSSNKGLDNKVLKSSSSTNASGYYSSNTAGSSGAFSSSTMGSDQNRINEIKKQNQKSAQNTGKPGSNGSLS